MFSGTRCDSSTRRFSLVIINGILLRLLMIDRISGSPLSISLVPMARSIAIAQT